MEENLKHGAFSWSELTTPAPAASVAFYTKVFNWNTEVMPMPGFDYTLLKVGDRSVGGLMQAGPGMPTAWTPYVTVDNIDETVKLAESLGATICVPPTDIPEVGRFAIFADPQGAIIAAITYIKK